MDLERNRWLKPLTYLEVGSVLECCCAKDAAVRAVAATVDDLGDRVAIVNERCAEDLVGKGIGVP